jgi:predicted outer membrane repeat protein
MAYFKNKSVWSDFFIDNLTHEHKGSLSRISLSSGGAYVHNSLFQNLAGSSSGGAIYSESVTVNVLVEETSFISCTPSGSGGALYLSITGESIITKVCGSRCRATSNHFMFSYVSITNSYDKRNSFLHSSVCNTVENTYYRTTRHEYGKVLFESSNISNNQCYYTTGIYSRYQTTSNSNEIGFNVKYSSFTNNKVIKSVCLEVYNSASICIKQFQSINLINNTSGYLSSDGIIHATGKLLIKDSTILGNTGGYQVYENSGSSGSIISNCTIDFTTSSVTSGVTITNSPSTSFINKISGFSTGECKSSYDSFGELKVTPEPTKIKRLKITCDWNNNIVINPKMISELILFIFSYLS